MKAGATNQLVQSLGAVCRQEPIAEKLVLAPSRRVGFQWLDHLARSGTPVMNVRVGTLQTLALNLAAPQMDAGKLRFLRGHHREVLAARLIGELLDANPKGYLAALKPSPGLTRTVLRCIGDLRLAGLDAGDLQQPAFEVPLKGRAIALLLAAWERELAAGKLLDLSGVLRLAAERLGRKAAAWPESRLALMPGDEAAGLSGLTRDFWEAIPAGRRRELSVDRPKELPDGGKPTRAVLLRWLLAPQEAPRPPKDDTVSFFRAVGEANEVREVFRRCVEGRIPLDEVEVVHTDRDTYVPLLFETGLRLAPAGSPPESVPVAFADGLPARYFRPGRALTAWVGWVREGCPQEQLARMIQEGLLEIPDQEDDGASLVRLASVMRALPIGAGRERYLPVIAGQIRGASARLHGSGRGDEDQDAAETAGRLRLRLEALKRLEALLEALLGVTPEGAAAPAAILDAALAFLERLARAAGRMDSYGRGRLAEEIAALKECLADGRKVPGLDAWGWLADLPASVRVGGQGPRPGCIFVSGLDGGGHSGRRHTFVVGLDDARFPGGSRQDPLLLDEERRALSGHLPTAAERLAAKRESLAALLARLRGDVTLSYPCRDLVEDREVQPSTEWLAAYRIVSGRREADLQAMLRDLGAPVSFAPGSDRQCLDATEWWLRAACREKPPGNAGKLLAALCPHLDRGLAAARHRAGESFSEYDGHVPEAGADLDLAGAGGVVFSGSRLETLGRRPMEFFFKYILEIEPPEDFELDLSVWLNPAVKGQLLHAGFKDFMRRLQAGGRLPVYDRDLKAIMEIITRRVAEYRECYPVPSEEVFENERRQLERAARIFLREEEAAGKSAKPEYFEVALGMAADGEGSPLDSPEPVAVKLPGGKTIRVRGRIDRIDRLPGGKSFGVVDYKTGRSGGYSRKDPFNAGRHVQNVLYLAMAEARLRQVVGKDAKVSKFGYFFPGQAEMGKRIEWPAEKLHNGLKVVNLLVEMVVKGCFPLSDDKNDFRHTDYAAAFGDADAGCQAVKKKLASAANADLAPFRDLRNFAEDEKEAAPPAATPGGEAAPEGVRKARGRAKGGGR